MAIIADLAKVEKQKQLEKEKKMAESQNLEIAQCPFSIISTVIIGDRVPSTVNPPDLRTSSSPMSQPPYGIQMTIG